VPEELRKEIAKCTGDLSLALEQVFLRVRITIFISMLRLIMN
jgi:hypothetical protein